MKIKRTSLETLQANKMDIDTFREWSQTLERIASLIVNQEQRKVQVLEQATRFTGKVKCNRLDN